MTKLKITVTYVRVNPGSVNNHMHGTRSVAEFALARARVLGQDVTCVATSVDPEGTVFAESGHMVSRLALPRGVISYGRDGNYNEAVKQHAIDTSVGRLGKTLNWQTEPKTRTPLFPLGLQFMPPRHLPGYNPVELVMWQIEDHILGSMLRECNREFGVEFEFIDQDVNIEIE